MKCLPTAKIPLAKGIVIHDSHAEILAVRAFNHFILGECAALIDCSYVSPFVRRRTLEEMMTAGSSGDSESGSHIFQPFAVREDVAIHMYCSEAPCGDASMEVVMENMEDATPWAVKNMEGSGAAMQGRGYFSELGIVRRKPGRKAS